MTYAERVAIAHIQRRIEEQLAQADSILTDWYERGYVHYSDVQTHSSHLRRVAPEERSSP